MPLTFTETPPTLAVGRVIAGRYRLLRHLGRGFLGDTFLAERAGPARRPPPGQTAVAATAADARVRHCVLKLLHPIGGSAVPVARAAPPAEQTHPNLAPSNDSGLDEESGRRFLVLPWIDGVDWITAARFVAPAEIPRLLAPVCRGLVRLHEQGIIHGRLHAGNCRVLRRRGAGEPAVLLCDFGLAPGTDREGPRLDFTTLGRMVLRALVPAPLLPERGELGTPEKEDAPELGALLRDVVDPQSAALAYVIRRCLRIDSAAPFDSPLEILDELNRRASLDLPMKPPELRRSLLFEGPMIGRGRELDRLKMRLEALVGGSLGVPVAPLVVLVGDEGVGKTRLMKELLAHASKRNLAIHTGACQANFRHPYLPLEGVIQSLVESVQQRREREGISLDASHPLLAKYGTELVKISPSIGLQHGFKASPLLEPEQEKMRLIDQTSCFIHDTSRYGPILLAIEDLHASDEGTLDLIRHLSRANRGGSVHVLATARREAAADSLLRRLLDEGSGAGWLEQIPVERLSDSDLQRLLSELLPLEDPGSDDVRGRICLEASGNPCHLQEILRLLVEAGALSPAGSKWSVSRERLEDATGRHGINRIFLARLERGDPAPVELLRMLAVYGGGASVEQLSRMLSRPRWDVQRELEDLVDRAILSTSRAGDSILYTFLHAGHGEALLEAAPGEEKQILHSRAAQELTTGTAPGDLSRQALLSGHLLAHGATAEAIDQVLSVAKELLRRNATREAHRLLGSIKTQKHLPLRQQVKLFDALADSYRQQGDAMRAGSLYEEALLLCREGGLEDERAELLVGLARARLWIPDQRFQRRGLEAAREGYRVLCRQDRPALMKRLLSTWAGYFVDPGRYEIANRLLSKAQRIDVRDDSDSIDTLIAINQGITAALQGHLSRARTLLTRSVETAERSHDVSSALQGMANQVYVSHLAADYKSAESLLTQVQIRMEQMPGEHEPTLMVGVAMNLAGRGQLIEAEELLRSLRNDNRHAAKTSVMFGSTALLGQILIWLGRVRETDDLLREAEEIINQGVSSHAIHFLRVVQAEGVLSRGDGEAGQRILQECRARARGTGNRRQEAEAIGRILLEADPWLNANDRGCLTEVLYELASDGESHAESITSMILRSRAAARQQEYETARSLLDGALSEAELRGAEIWALRVIHEQWQLSKAWRDEGFSGKVASRAEGRVERILRTIQDQSHQRDFLSSPLARAYVESCGTSGAGKQQELPREEPEQADLLQSFLISRGEREPLQAYLAELRAKPAFVAVRSCDGLRFERVDSTSKGVDGNEVLRQLEPAISTGASERKGTQKKGDLPVWTALKLEPQGRWGAAAAHAEDQSICFIYCFPEAPTSEQIRTAQLAVFLASQLLSTGGRSSAVAPSPVPAYPAPAAAPDDALIVGRSAAIRRVLAKIQLAAKGEVGVLIQGESGTGKELVAKRIHQFSVRSARPFLAIDCGAIPENLIESELFGFRKGAFTGADRDKPGVFEGVQGGTLLLDEIGNAGANFQAKLLRVLQEREVRRIGETRPRPVDVRVIAATNADLRRACETGRFREDLLYRLSVVTVEVPPLRERIEDIPLLGAAFLGEIQAKGMKTGALTGEALQVLMSHSWPGNVRELNNALQVAALAADGAPILPAHLPDTIQGQKARPDPSTSHPTVHRGAETEAEQQMLLEALQQSAGDKTAACASLGWNRMKLYRRLRRYNLPLDSGKPARK